MSSTPRSKRAIVVQIDEGEQVDSVVFERPSGDSDVVDIDQGDDDDESAEDSE